MKRPGLNAFSGILQMFKMELIPIGLKIFQKEKKKRRELVISYSRRLIFVLIQKPEKTLFLLIIALSIDSLAYLI